MNFYDNIKAQVEVAPERAAVVFEGRELSYSELDERVRRFAAGLAEAGVERGQRVLVYTPNLPDQLVVYLGCAAAGVVFAPANIGFRARELGYVCANAQPVISIVHEDHLDAFRAFTADVADAPRRIYVIGATGPVGGDVEGTFEDLLSDAPVPAALDCEPDADLLLIYTSGTTSAPKPVLHSHRSESFKANAYGDAWTIRAGDVGIVSMPMSWGFGLTSCETLLTAGGTIELLSRFHPVEVVRAVERSRATVMLGTMTMYSKMLEVLAGEPRDLSTLRVTVNGGEPSTQAAVDAFEGATGCRLVGSYAMTEARPILVIRPDDPGAPTGTCGKLVPGSEIRLLGDDGQPVAAGESGEAEVRCPGMMTAYYREPELTGEKLTDDGWVRTGDLLVADPDGYYFVVGRRSDMIIRSGANVAPAEIESVLLAHDHVADATVVGVPDERSGEAIVAFVVLAGAGDLDADALHAFMVAELAAFKVPQHFLAIDEMPATANGKRDRRTLRTIAEQRLSQAAH
jgi:long-chain acyl-CoA synthetase